MPAQPTHIRNPKTNCKPQKPNSVLYDADPSPSSKSQTSLSPHTDGCLLSFNILLNEPSAFIGGGTRFPTLDKTILPNRGDCVVHDAKLLHEGKKITSGRRVICVGFVETRRDGPIGQKRPGRGMSMHNQT